HQHLTNRTSIYTRNTCLFRTSEALSYLRRSSACEKMVRIPREILQEMRDHIKNKEEYAKYKEACKELDQAIADVDKVMVRSDLSFQPSDDSDRRIDEIRRSEYRDARPVNTFISDSLDTTWTTFYFDGVGLRLENLMGCLKNLVLPETVISYCHERMKIEFAEAQWLIKCNKEGPNGWMWQAGFVNIVDKYPPPSDKIEGARYLLYSTRMCSVAADLMLQGFEPFLEKIGQIDGCVLPVMDDVFMAKYVRPVKHRKSF
ncbi:hypothetical protein FB567DRAFT_607014, partial [Paraphoma chrysanthemicola]